MIDYQIVIKITLFLIQIQKLAIKITFIVQM
jgi:hypothetical protein